jgi:hypothetical protein
MRQLSQTWNAVPPKRSNRFTAVSINALPRSVFFLIIAIPPGTSVCKTIQEKQLFTMHKQNEETNKKLSKMLNSLLQIAGIVLL